LKMLAPPGHWRPQHAEATNVAQAGLRLVYTVL
jgi:hypothetical protein